MARITKSTKKTTITKREQPKEQRTMAITPKKSGARKITIKRKK